MYRGCFPPPPECLRLLEDLEATEGPVKRLSFIAGPASPAIAIVNGVPTYALVQDLVPQPDILAQALVEVGLLPQEEPPLLSPSDSSQDTEQSEDDTLMIGAERILRWLEDNEILPDNDQQSDHEIDEDDSRRPAALTHGPPFKPVRKSSTPPKVNWDALAPIVGYYPPADPSSLRIACDKASVVNNTPPKPEQLPIIREAVQSMCVSGIIEKTKRGPYLNPVQLVPKSSTESRFVLNCAALTPHLKAPKFQLPPLPVVLQKVPLPDHPYFTKLDLSEAYYHFGLHPSARQLTTFKVDNNYYRFTVLPFGIRPAPFIMQMFSNALSRYLNDQGVWAWSHLDNFLIAHSDPHYLQTVTSRFLDMLVSNGECINPKDTVLQPTQQIKFLCFTLDGLTETIGHSAARIKELEQTLQVLLTQQTIKTYQRIAGHWAFYFSLYGGHYHVLRPMYRAAIHGRPVDPTWINAFSRLWQELQHNIPWRTPEPMTTAAADASDAGMGVCLPSGNVAIVSPHPRGIYLRELTAVCLAAILCPKNSHPDRQPSVGPRPLPRPWTSVS